MAQGFVTPRIMLTISVRLNGLLLATIGTPRLTVSLPEQSTVAGLREALETKYPGAGQLLRQAIPVIGGQPVGPEARLDGVSEVAFLMPVAGGRSGDGPYPVPAA